jgi:hypothetical protein
MSVAGQIYLLLVGICAYPFIIVGQEVVQCRTIVTGTGTPRKLELEGDWKVHQCAT